MKQFIIVTLFIFNSTFCILNSTFSQDVHFSQFYFSPLTTNPAQTGFFNGKYRLAVNYRDQWDFVPLPFRTYSASFDMHILDIGHDVLGGGIYFVNDKAGDKGVNFSGEMVSIAYHKDFAEGLNKFAFGMQGGMMKIGFDPSILRFGDQIDKQKINGGVDGTTSENFPNTSDSYFDLNAGVLWHFIPSEIINVYVGLSTLHLVTPAISFLNDPSSDLSSRFVLQGGTAVSLNSNLDILPAVLYMKQAGNKEFYLGSAVRFNFEEGSGVRFGAWYRNSGNGDAFVLMTGLDYKNFKLGLSYDFNISSLKKVSKSKGGFEIALIYIFTPPKKKSKGGGISCPTF